MPFNSEELERARQLHIEARGFVQSSGLIILENHANPHSRGLLANLIEDGVVTTLFLEVVEQKMENFPMFDQMESTEGKRFGEWLRSCADSSMDLRENEAWSQFRQTCHYIFPADKKNPISTARLMEVAVKRGVKIYLVDCDTKKSPLIPKSMLKRDNYMAAEIKEVAGDSCAGAVLLTGKKHAHITLSHMRRVEPFDPAVA